MLFVDSENRKIAFEVAPGADYNNKLAMEVVAAMTLYRKALYKSGITSTEEVDRLCMELATSKRLYRERRLDTALAGAGYIKATDISAHGCDETSSSQQASSSQETSVSQTATASRTTSASPATQYYYQLVKETEDLLKDEENDAAGEVDRSDDGSDEGEKIPSAKSLYDYLNTCVWKQDEAKRAAAILVHNVLSGRRQNMMFAGPSGCGKTFIWKKLAEKLNPIYPNLINVFDGSTVTTEGFKGQNKWGTMVGRLEFADGRPHILIIDEADKFIAPKYTSNGENVSVTLMSEALKTMEGATIDVASRRDSIKLDCGKLSFVFCGAFSLKAEAIAEKESGCSIGFLASNNKVEAYDRKLEVKDIISFGAMPEFMGRIERVVNLEPMREDDFYNILMDANMGPIKELQDLYGIEITLSKDRVAELAKIARDSKLGMRDIRNHLRREVDEILFENADAQVACL